MNEFVAEFADLFRIPPRPVAVLARASDPETSHDAAAELAADTDKQQRSIKTVVAILAAHGPCTDFDLADRWPAYWKEPFSASLPAKARHWARLDGLVRLAGHGDHHGRRVRTWELGKEELAPLVTCKECGHRSRKHGQAQ